MSKKEGEKIAKLKRQLRYVMNHSKKKVHEMYDLNTYNSLKKSI